MKNILIGAALLVAAFQSNAQIDPCPGCPPVTNGMATNIYSPAEFPTNALLIREASITSGGVLLATNTGWQTDTNGLLIYGPTIWTTNVPAGSTWDYLLGITNSDSNHVYSVQYTPDLIISPTNLFRFIGSAGEVFTNVVVSSQLNGFWRVKQEDGFVLWKVPGYAPSGPGACPRPNLGYANYRKPFPDFGYKIDSNAIVHSATSLSPLSSALQTAGEFGDFVSVCNSNTVYSGTASPEYNFALFISTAVTFPTNKPQPIWLNGFLP